MLDMKCLGIGIICMALAMCGCSQHEQEMKQEGQDLTFQLQSRVGNEISEDLSNRLVRLYVAERLSEHQNGEDLHCRFFETLTGSEYHLTGLEGQWLKFAFVAVPRLEGIDSESIYSEESPEEQTCDFNKLLLDYSSVMDYQKEAVNSDADLYLYRKIIDRWVDADSSPQTEDVTLERITGELVLNMGIPEDQFDLKDRDIATIQLILNKVPVTIWLHDEAENQVLTGSVTEDYIFDTCPVVRSKQKHIIKLVLPPCTLDASINVIFKDKVSGQTLPDTETYSLMGDGNTRIQIRPNTRTIVLFNGMTSEEFEVRYAGFAENSEATDDAMIDVDSDWNGWSN